MIPVESVSNLGPDYTPALRHHIIDPDFSNRRSELIWEGAYNGAFPLTRGQWYSGDGYSGNMWRFVTGFGLTLNGGAQVNQSVPNWVAGTNSPYDDGYTYSSNAYVAAISVGAGSSVGAGYLAYTDHVTIQFGALESTTYDFTDAIQNPEPTSISLVGAGCVLVALGLRRRCASPKE